jgi:hypothetical protein
MNSLQSMVSKMKSTGLYALGGDSLVDAELQAYAAGLSLAFDAYVQLENESFLGTATGYGIANWEKQFQLAPYGGEEERRSALLKRGAITPNHFTKENMEQALSMAGLKAEICENIPAKKLYVNCLNEATDSAARKAALLVGKTFLPAHLYAELDFRSISWNNIDQQDKSFDTMDGPGYTWDAIDTWNNGVLEI